MRAQLTLTVTLLGIVVFAVWPLLMGTAAPHWDASLEFAPAFSLVADFARHGQVLLWNPWSHAGNPDFADAELGTLSPVAMLVGVLFGGGLTGFAAYWILLWVLAGVGVQLLARDWGVPPAGAAVAALGYAFSGVFTGHAEHVSVLVSAAALPFVVWRFDRALRDSSHMAAAQAGVILGVSGHGGYPGVTVQTGALLLLWAVTRTFSPELPASSSSPSRRARFAAEAVFITGAVALVVLSPCYAGFFLEAVAHADRVAALDTANGLTNSLAPGALATVASPYVALLALQDPKWWPDNDVSSASIYMGPLVPALALAAVAGAKESRLRWGLLVIAAASLSLSLGHALPFRAWVNHAIPGFGHFRHPAMTRLFFVFSFVVLALTELRASPDVEERPGRWNAILCASLLCGAIAVLAFRAEVLRTRDRPDGLPIAEAHYLGVWIAGAGLAGLGRLGVFRERTRLLGALLAALAVVDAAFDVFISRPIVLESNHENVRTWTELGRRHEPSLVIASLDRTLVPPIGDGNQNFITKSPVLRSYSPFERPEQRAWVAEPALSRAALGPHRIFFNPTAGVLDLDAASLDRFVSRARELGAPPIVVPRGPAADAGSTGELGTTSAAAQIDVALSVYSPRRLAFEVDTPTSGWLLVTDRWAPGWSARVNGRETVVHRADFMFRGLRVPAGHVAVDFTYRPLGYPLLFLASFLTVFGIAAAAGASAYRSFRSRTRGA